MRAIAFAIIFAVLLVYDHVATRERGDRYRGEFTINLYMLFAFWGVLFS